MASPGDWRLSILADQLGRGAGGSRFTTGFLRALMDAAETRDTPAHITVLLTQNETPDNLGKLPARVSLLRRRFPSRLRGTTAEHLFRLRLPVSDVAHGLFYYVFPRMGRRMLLTMHDLSVFNDRYHPLTHNAQANQLAQTVQRCDTIVCTSQSICEEAQRMWPHLSDRFVHIYGGVSPLAGNTTDNARPAVLPTRPYILAVGTIEPRKNYDILLDAFEQLRAETDEACPDLLVVGRAGWMCEGVVARLETLTQSGHVHWLRNADDRTLAACYAHAALFSYPSLYEGFGYPPFEAALTHVPMVVSSASSVGEIWQGHARCVSPFDVRELVQAWRSLLALSSAERAAIVERQYHHAVTFTWQRCIEHYIDIYQSLAN